MQEIIWRFGEKPNKSTIKDKINFENLNQKKYDEDLNQKKYDDDLNKQVKNNFFEKENLLIILETWIIQ